MEDKDSNSDLTLQDRINARVSKINSRLDASESIKKDNSKMMEELAESMKGVPGTFVSRRLPWMTPHEIGYRVTPPTTDMFWFSGHCANILKFEHGELKARVASNHGFREGIDWTIQDNISVSEWKEGFAKYLEAVVSPGFHVPTQEEEVAESVNKLRRGGRS